jgi:hypothetical protein
VRFCAWAPLTSTLYGCAAAMKSSYAPGSDHALCPQQALSVCARTPAALLSPRSAVGFSSWKAFAQSLGSKVLHALRTAAGVAPLGDLPQPFTGLHKRSSRFERSSPFSLACCIFGSLSERRAQLYNQAVDTDAQGRSRAARALFFGRRSLLRYTGEPLQ